MTQAVNLANFANSLNSSGQVDPSVISSPVPVSKGGTGSSTASAARTALGVPANDGTGASGNWNIGSNKVVTTNWTIQESGGVLVFQYGGVTKFTMSSDGTFAAAV